MALTQALVRGSSRRLRICCVRSLSTPGIAVPSRLCSPGSPTPHQLGAFHGEIGPNSNRSDLEVLRGRLRRLLRRVTAGVVDPYPPIIAASVLTTLSPVADRCSQDGGPLSPSQLCPAASLSAACPAARDVQASTFSRHPPHSSSRVTKLKHVRMVGRHQGRARRKLPASLKRSVGPAFVRGPRYFYRIVSSWVWVLIDAGTALLFVSRECSKGNKTRPASRG